MMRRIGIALLLLTSGWGVVEAACPSRTDTYTAGQIIEPEAVTNNEDAIFNYLCGGVDTIDDNAVTTNAILDGTISSADLGSAAITSSNITDETIVSADIADGTIVNADVSTSAAIAFSKLGTLTSGNILVGSSGNVVTSVNPSGDVDVSNTGAFTVQANSVALGTDTTGNYAGSSSEGGAATTATALAANGANCTAGNYPLGVDTAGAVESCTAVPSALVTNLVTFTRTAAAGDGEVTVAHGIAVDPDLVLVFCEADADDASWGMGDDDDDEALLQELASGGTASFESGTTNLISVNDGGGNAMSLVYTSDDATNLTLTWTKSASGMNVTCQALVGGS